MCGVKMENEKNFNEIMQHKFFKDNADNLSILFKYFTARIDLKNCGESDNNLIILENSDSDSVVYCPKWYKNYEGIGTVITSKKGCIDLKIKCVNEGILKIGLRGIDFKDSKNTRVPIYIDYTKFLINGHTIFDSRLSICHDMPYSYSRDNVKNDDIFDIHIEWEPFGSNSIYRS